MSEMLERQHIVEVRIEGIAAFTPSDFTHAYPLLLANSDLSHPQNQFSESLHALHKRLITIEELQTQFTEYQLSYNKLVVEMGRRLQYREAAENIVRGMIDQLAAMTEGSRPILSRLSFGLLKFICLVPPSRRVATEITVEEREIRATFNAEQGSNLPADLCLCVENMPTRWNVVPVEEHSFEGISSGYREDYRETLPIVDSGLLAEVCLTDISRNTAPDLFHAG